MNSAVCRVKRFRITLVHEKQIWPVCKFLPLGEILPWLGKWKRQLESLGEELDEFLFLQQQWDAIDGAHIVNADDLWNNNGKAMWRQIENSKFNRFFISWAMQFFLETVSLPRDSIRTTCNWSRCVDRDVLTCHTLKHVPVYQKSVCKIRKRDVNCYIRYMTVCPQQL